MQKELDFIFEEVFKYRGRTCFIVRVETHGLIPNMTEISEYRNGYVQTTKQEQLDIEQIWEDIESVEIGTISSFSDFKTNHLAQMSEYYDINTTFLGFDTLSLFYENEDRTIYGVKKLITQLCDEMIANGY